MRVYVSGPMTGLPNLNFPAFNRAAEHLRSLGHEVVNPAESPLPDGLPWSDYLRHDIAEIVTCDAIHMLRGWRTSKGARLERHIAIALGLVLL